MAAKKAEAVDADRYCGSKWAHKQHGWFDEDGNLRYCSGATTAEKPNKGDPARKGS